MKRRILIGLAVLVIATIAYADNIYQYCRSGNCTMQVKTGSTIDVDSGGTLDLNSGSTLTNAATGTHSGTNNFTGSFAVDGVAAAVTATCAQGAESGTDIALTITFKDSAGTAIEHSADSFLSFTTDGGGLTIVSSSNDADSVTATTGRTVEAGVASTQDIFHIRTNTSGVWAATITKSGTGDIYPSVSIPLTGQIAACAIMDFD